MTKEIDWTKPIQTKDGCKARVRCTDVVGPCPYLVLIYNDKLRGELPYLHREDGSLFNGTVEEDTAIINVPEEHTVWVNLYKSQLANVGRVYSSRKSADTCAPTGRTACIKLTYTDGEGLE